MDALRIVPIFAVVRRAGTIVDVSDWLLRSRQLRREQVVGRDSREIWPQSGPWLEADRQALKLGELETYEASPSGRWWRSRRVRLNDDLVLWTGEDATAAVQLAAMRAIDGLAARKRAFVVNGSDEAAFVAALLSDADLTLGGKLPLETIAGSCVRILSR